MSLSEKQKRFVEEYLIDLNATQAAIRSGYSEKTAKSQGQRLLTKVDVATAVAAAQAKRSKRTQVTQDRVIEELAKIGFSDFRNLIDDTGALKAVSDWDDNTAGAVASLEVVAGPEGGAVHKLRTWDKRAALETLLKHVAGTSDDDAPALNINITTSEAVKDLRVTRSDG